MPADPAIPDPRVVAQFTDSDLAFGRVVVPVPNQNKPPRKRNLGSEYMEHSYIGDSIKLMFTDGEPVAASSHKFRFPNGLVLTYGQINALAGGFYGTYNPISDGESDEDRSARFLLAYDTLADGGPRQPKEANAILAVLQAEVDAVNNALMHHQDPSVAYSTLPDVTLKLEEITFGRCDIPSYLGLSRINWDHFGDDARTVYNVGHTIAIRKALDGDLEGAYALNAFADRFLEASFSSGYLRTPRRLLHKPTPDLTADICAKFMHDEDRAIGFRVKNPAGESWECYGDQRALEEAAAENLKRCVAAVQASADEIYAAYSTEQVPSPSAYAAWRIAPTLESARSTSQVLAMLFTPELERRQDIKNRRVWKFKKDWWFWSTAAECKASGYWRYPITLNGVHTVIPWSGISVVSPSIWSPRVFYQTSGGAIIRSAYSEGQWIHSHDQPIFSAVPFTPLASITWKDGKEIRVYYLDREYILREHRYTERKGWFAGDIGNMGIRPSTNTHIGAIQYSDRLGGVHIRVYYQEAGSLAIGELCHDGGHWLKGSLRIPNVLDGTSIAAATFNFTPEIRVYYQAEDLSLREYGHGSKGWYLGHWSPGKVPGGSPISVVAYTLDDGSTRVQAYWRNLQGEIVTNKYAVKWGPTTKVLEGIRSGSQFTLLQWEKGRHLRLYYQNHANAVVEHGSDNGGETWYQGALRVGGITLQA